MSEEYDAYQPLNLSQLWLGFARTIRALLIGKNIDTLNQDHVKSVQT